MRRPFLAGNWKMNLACQEARRLAQDLRQGVGALPDRDVAVFPTALCLEGVAQALAESPIRVGGQNCHQAASGAFTGELSAAMLRSAGASLVILGHSERRHIFHEDDELVGRKVTAALEARLQPILCVGETLQERQEGRTFEVVERQLRAGLAHLSREMMAQVTLAYEPVWAIGTGQVATPDQAQEVHAALRGTLRELSRGGQEDMRILYGGSVKGSNVDGLMAQVDIDGALVGGASLNAEEFVRIVQFRPSADG